MNKNQDTYPPSYPPQNFPQYYQQPNSATTIHVINQRIFLQKDPTFVIW